MGRILSKGAINHPCLYDALADCCPFAILLILCSVIFVVLTEPLTSSELLSSNEALPDSFFADVQYFDHSSSDFFISADFPGLQWKFEGIDVFHADEPIVNETRSSESDMRCVGRTSETRTCRIHNACLDVYEYALVLFAGENSIFHFLERASGNDTTNKVPLEAATMKGSDPPFIFSSSTRYDSDLRFAFAIRNGDIPANQIWIDAPYAILSRVDPMDTINTVFDDFFPLWWLLTRFMGRSLDSSRRRTSTLGVLWWDRHREVLEEYDHAMKRFAQWFPGVTEIDVYGARTTIARPEEGKSLVCFRSLTVGTTGRSMLRNAASGFIPQRTFPEQNLEPSYRDYYHSHAEFSNDIIASLDLPSKADMQTGFDRNSTRGEVLFLVREEKKSDLINADSLIIALSRVCDGRVIRKVRLDSLPLREEALLLLKADVTLAIHGDADTSLLFMRPGTSFIDLLPPRATAVQPALVGFAQRLGVKLFTLPVIEQDCSAGSSVTSQSSYTIDVDATLGLVALALGHEP